MKYSLDIDIDLPRERVIELFDNPANIKHWQKDIGFQSFESISGTHGEIGSKARLKYKMDGQDIEMIETLTHKDFPNQFSGTYEMPGMLHKLDNYFSEVDPHTTKWKSDVEINFSGFFMRVMGWLSPKAFKKTSYKMMESFKSFAEEQK